MTTTPGFHGWSQTAVEFYEGLSSDNSKRYWQANRGVYDLEVKAPMLSLLAELEPEFGEGRIFRPNRDVRFSADKSPYKTSIAATVGGFYVAFEASGLTAGAGYYHLSAAQLERYRSAVADDRSGGQLEEIVHAPRSKGIRVRSFDELRTAPRGIAKDHARIELLRYKDLVAMTFWPTSPSLATKTARRRVEEVFRSGRPMLEWLDHHVGSAEDR